MASKTQRRRKHRQRVHHQKATRRLLAKDTPDPNYFAAVEQAEAGTEPEHHRMRMPTRRGRCPVCQTSQKTTVLGRLTKHGDCGGAGQKPVSA